MSSRVKKLKDKAYREAYIASQVFTSIPYQVRALRKQNVMDQTELADKAGMKQSRISAIENPNNNALNLDTLIRLAAAFDVGLVVKFAPFSELLRFQKNFSPDTFRVTSFEDELNAGYLDNISTTTVYSAAPFFVLETNAESTGVTARTEIKQHLSNFDYSYYQVPHAEAN